MEGVAVSSNWPDRTAQMKQARKTRARVRLTRMRMRMTDIRVRSALKCGVRSAECGVENHFAVRRTECGVENISCVAWCVEVMFGAPVVF
jgi:hypothetical protein